MADVSLSTKVLVQANTDSAGKTVSWTVTDSNENVFTITDTNSNGQWDNTDLIKAMNAGDTLSAEDRIEARYKISELDGVTSDEMALMEEYRQQQAALKEKSQQVSTPTTTTATPTTGKSKKKGNFWDKLGQVSLALMPALTSITGAIAAIGSWQYSPYSGNDWAQKMMGITTGTTMALTGTATTLSMLNNQNNMLSFPTLNLSGLTADNSFTQTGVTSTSIASQYDAALAKLGSQEGNNDKASIQQYQTIINELYTTLSKSGDCIIDEGNKDTIQSFYLDNTTITEEIAKERLEILAKINAYHTIPYGHVASQSDVDTSTKITANLATAIDTKIKQYEQITDDAEKAKIMTKENYKTLKSILSQVLLTADDITTLTNIIKKPLE